MIKFMFNHSLNKFIKVRGYKKNKRNENFALMIEAAVKYDKPISN